MTLNAGKARHRTASINEYFENERLFEDPASDPCRAAFVNALKDYGRQMEHGKKAQLLEAVIRTSRGLHDDVAKLPAECVEILTGIQRRYHAFLAGPELAAPRTYSEGRTLLKALFF